MKTLLIDNYDSFTFNLYQLIAELNGQSPIVVRNDEVSWSRVQALEFDNIVISPGPGRPQRSSDLGLSADAISHATVPILGVCLGHQAIVHLSGGRVGFAQEPVHGRLSVVVHDGSELFADIPKRFRVVRYHSLAVHEIPDLLQATAWASDGTIMALRHTTRPVWGVQFHPESICTEHGAVLLRNFRDLTPTRRALRGGRQGPRPSRHPANLSEPIQRVHWRRLERFVDPEQAFLQLYRESPNAFWLDSSLAQDGRSRFSYMGDASGPRAKVIRYVSATGTVEVVSSTGSSTVRQSVFDYLEESIANLRVERPDLPFDFACGYAGYFGYELKGELGAARAASAATPDAAWILADRMLAFDHKERQVWLLCLDLPELSDQGAQWFDRTKRALLACGEITVIDIGTSGAERLNFSWRHEPARYQVLISEAMEQIRQGETYEVCLTNQLTARGQIDALLTYRTLRRINPAPYAAFLRFDEVAIMSASPELFLSVSESGSVESRPIKGTNRRGTTPMEDARLADELANSEKDRSENLMIVDLLRNDLGRVCEIGSVHVPELFVIESYATVHQMVSTIRGQLRHGATALDCVRAAFPGGSMTGAPKLRTMAILDRLESGPRGVYSGSLGYFSLTGAARLNIVIRTIVADGEHVSIGAGGAIVALSDPEREVEEMTLKSRASYQALRLCGAAVVAEWADWALAVV